MNRLHRKNPFTILHALCNRGARQTSYLRCSKLRILPRATTKSLARFVRSFGLVALALGSAVSGVAAQATSRALDAKWEFRAGRKTDRPELQDWPRAKGRGWCQR